eukprot:COSAG05_NODE_3593_length_1971_cov_1390.068116_2_plen_378_part_00
MPFVKEIFPELVGFCLGKSPPSPPPPSPLPPQPPPSPEPEPELKPLLKPACHGLWPLRAPTLLSSKYHQLSCDTNKNFLDNLEFVQHVCCRQLNATCTGWVPALNTCGGYTCARAVVTRVMRDCYSFLNDSSRAKLWASQRLELAAAAHRCRHTASWKPVNEQGNTFVELAKFPEQQHQRTVQACTGTLVAGREDDSSSSWKYSVTLEANVGFQLLLTFNALWLPQDGTYLKIHDGHNESSRTIQKIEGNHLPRQVVATGSAMYIRLIVGSLNSEKPLAFSAEISCKWPASPCTQQTFFAQLDTIRHECCNDPDEKCDKDGKPQTCSIGCAEVQRSIHNSCQALIAKHGYIGKLFRDISASCKKVRSEGDRDHGSGH